VEVYRAVRIPPFEVDFKGAPSVETAKQARHLGAVEAFDRAPAAKVPLRELDRKLSGC